MRRTCIFALAGFLLAVAGVFVAGSGFGRLRAAEGEEPKSGGPPPLVIDRSDLLLLDEKPAGKPDKSQKPLADNSACFVCHGNYEEEEFAVLHAREDVGCIECHGDSFDHRNDEDNVTPPDIMYWPERIEPKCQECHEEHDVPAREVLTRWQQRCPQKTDFTQVVCTDCHGNHRLAKRTVRWEKKTGKVVVGEKAAPATQAAGE